MKIYLEILERDYARSIKDKAELALYQCNCGIKKVIRIADVRSGRTKSCGCYNRKLSTTHNMTKTSEHRSWSDMKSRCTNNKHKRYKDWGGRGIMVCERWLNSFENFYADMGPKPTKAHSIDRIDNDGNYEPSNCRWATKKEQQGNSRRQKRVILNKRSILDFISKFKRTPSGYRKQEKVLCNAYRSYTSKSHKSFDPIFRAVAFNLLAEIETELKDTDLEDILK